MTQERLDARAVKRRKILDALLSEPTNRLACKKSGLSESTFYNILREPEFQSELQKRLDEIAEHAVNQIKRLTETAVATLADGLDAEQDINTRLRAAKYILDYYTKHRELNEFDRRLRALEENAQLRGL